MEMIDNAVDEALGGDCKNICSCCTRRIGQVTDDGRGIPVDAEKNGLWGVEVEVHEDARRRQVGGGSYVATEGCTAWAPWSSTRCPHASTSRSTRTGSPGRDLSSGTPGEFDGEGYNADSGAGNELRRRRKVKKGVTETEIRYWATDRSSSRARRTATTSSGAGSPDVVPRARPRARHPDAWRGDPDRDVPPRRRHPGVCDFLTPESPSPTSGDCRATTRSPRSPLDDKGHMTLRRSPATSRSTSPSLGKYRYDNIDAPSLT